MKVKTLFLLLLVIPLSYSFFGNSGSSTDNPDLKNLIEDEKNSVQIFKETVNSVVNVSSIRLARTWWDIQTIEVPAGAGSGIIWDKDGHIVTNFHVVADGGTFRISFHKNKKQFEAKIVGAEPKKDIAVLKVINGPNNIIPIKRGTSKNLVVGQKAVAIGNPFGMDHTMTTGIVSALDRKIPGFGGVEIRGMIQTDASINPGNSGGPLLSSKGELIGMNTLIFSSSGSSAGIGFSVPVDTINRIVPQLIKHGKVIRPVLGIGILPDQYRDHFDIQKGLAIMYIDKNGPAARAGLQGMTRDRWGQYYLGDIILAIDGHELNTYDDIFHIMEKYKIGDTVEVTFLRNKKRRKVKVKLDQAR